MRGEVLPRLSFGEGVGSGGEAFPGRLGISAPWRLVFRDVAQSGSAPEWGSGGRGFKSRRPDSNGEPKGSPFFVGPGGLLPPPLACGSRHSRSNPAVPIE